MKRKFTFLLAVLMLLSGLTWAQSDYSTDYTGNVTLSTAGGTSASACKIKINYVEYNGVKAGTGSVAGAMSITVPANTKYLHLHVAAWKNENVTLAVTPTGYSDNITLTSNSGISNNSPFTFNGDPSTSDYYKVITFSTALSAETTLTFSATGGKRFVVWGVTAEEEGSNQNPSITASNVDIAYDATSGAIEYTINNPATNGQLSAATTSDWLTLGTVGATVPFSCTANTAAAARTATVTLTYAYGEDQVSKNVTVTQAGNPNVIDNISDIAAAGTYTVQGTIVAKSQRGFIVGDGTGYVYYYNQNYTQADYNIGDMVKLAGSVVVYGGVFEFNNSTTITAATSSNYVAEDPTVLSGSDMDTRVASTTPPQLSNYVQYEGTLSVSKTHYNITNIDGATTAQGSISYPLDTVFTSLNGSLVKVTGYYVGISSSTYYNTMIGTVEEVTPGVVITPPTFSPVGGTYTEVQTVTISCENTDYDIYYTLDGADPDMNSTLYEGPITVSETTTIKAIAVDGDDHTSAVASATYTINLPAPMETFNMIEGHNPVEGETYLIVDLHSGRALTSENGSSSAPTAVEVTITDNQIETDNAYLQWVFEATENGYIIHPVGDNEKWLYSTAVNNGVRVGDNQNNVWTLDVTDESNPNYHGFKHNGTSRYLGVYSNQDWRAYETVNNNIKDTQIALFVLGEAPSPNPSITAHNVNIAYNATNGAIEYTINHAPDPAGSLTATTAASWITLGTVTSSQVPFTCVENTEATERTATVTLTYVYDGGTVTKDVTVTQAGFPLLYTTIPDLFAAATSTETAVFVTFNNWVVSGISTNGMNVFVTDNNGNGFVIFDNNGGLDNTYTAGDILAGTAVSCKLKKYNGFAELLNVNATDLTITAGGTVSTSTIAMADLSGVHTGALVHYDYLTCSVNNNKYYLSDGTTTIQVYNALYAFDALVDGKTYNITGIYQQYNNTKEILPRSADDIEEVEVLHDEYTLTVSNLVHVTTYVFDASNQSEPLLIGAGQVDIFDGTEVLISVDVEEGYVLESLMVGGTDVTSQIVDDVYMFTMPTNAVAVTATAVESVVPVGGDFVRITSLDQLTDGSIVVIASRYDMIATNYFAMKNTISNGKAQSAAFVSTTLNGNEILSTDIVDEIDDYYWVVSVTENGYTFTNANHDVIGYGSSSNFNMIGNNTNWDIARGTSGAALVPSYEGYNITNVNYPNRCIAFRGDTEVFGPYSTQNITDDNYNFFLDLFVQTEASPIVTQTLELTEGWNDISIYLEIADEDEAVAMLDQLKEALGENGLLITGDDGFTMYEDEEWFGDLDEVGVTNEQSYSILVGADCTVVLQGTLADPADHPITINPGWNMIGFPYSEEVEVETALSEFEAEDLDMLVNNDGFTMYEDEEWFGDVTTMVPGQGYLYFSNSTETKRLIFKTTASKTRRVIPTLGKVYNEKLTVKVNQIKPVK